MRKFTFITSTLCSLLLDGQTPYPNSSALGLKCWLKADAGTIITSPPTVDQWNEQSGAGITGDFFPSLWDACPPDFVSNSYNYNPTIKFELGTNAWNFCNYSGLYSANTMPGNTLFDPVENTIFMVKEPKFGIVELKWENNFMGVDYRFGVELSGNKQRFDFVNQGAGQVNVSNTNILNKFHMGEYLTDATNLSLYLNGAYDSGIPNTGLVFNPPINDLFSLSVSCNSVNWQLYSEMNLSELLIFNKKLTITERREVESYLAIKYGLTIGNNQFAGPSLDYLATDGTPVWDSHPGFHNHILGVGRDDASGLKQYISKGESSLDGTLDMLKIANGSFAAPVNFVNDKSYVVTGSNLGSIYAPVVATFTHSNPQTVLFAHMSRIWAMQKTGTPTGNLLLEFDMSQLNGPNSNADIRLIIDNDLSFSNSSPGESTHTPQAGYAATGGYLYFSVPYTSIPSKGYFTLASADLINTPLPIRIKEFEVNCNNSIKSVSWTTSSEFACSTFTLFKSVDGNEFHEAKTYNCNGLNQDINYVYVDSLEKTKSDAMFYMLSFSTGGQAPENYYPNKMVTCNGKKPGSLEITATNNNGYYLDIQGYMPEAGAYTIDILDCTGKMIESLTEKFDKGESFYRMSLNSSCNGIYLLRIAGNGQSTSKKILLMQ